ncbi:sialic acid-binding Ig-like lectin 5 [Scomber scombrus]|uniref:sialic acid-binding Ig-like lectin 5 n=1 Tax=Scomber scombrus TaxID=13677 RepID=UPI002DDBA8ED|nr:sialic acid-binding Ig-like lectin 5 [Scomber scombrus]
MFVLIWATLLFSLRGNSADTGASVRQRQHCPNPGYCITLTEGEITAEAGLCVVIPCSFTTGIFIPQHIVWYKCEPLKERCSDSDIIFHTYTNNRKVQPGFIGRVSLLETDLSQKTCSIVINDITESDSGSYQLRVNGMWLGKMDGFTFPQKATISVKALSQKPTVMVPPLTEGQQITLTCTAPGLCSGSVPTITWTWRGRGEKTAEITGNLTERKTENITAVTQRHSSTLTFNASAEHHGTQVTCKVGFTGDTATEETVTLNVTYMRKAEITGDVIVKEGDTLNLTCNAESFPPSLITWSKLGLNTSLHSRIDVDLQNNTGLSTLIIPNVTTEHSGCYICTVKHVDNTLTLHADVTVARFAKILKGSGCVAQSTALTCVCMSQGVPLPTIKWPMIENHNEYSVITTVSKHTVNSTITLPVTDHRNTAVECVSSNGNGEAKENLTIQIHSPKKEGQSTGLLSIVSRLDIIIAFLIGVLLTTTLCCLAKTYNRKNQKSSGSLDGTLEMVTAQEDPLIHPDQAVQDNQTHHQEAPKDGAEGVERGAPDLYSAAKDVEYASIDFSVLKRRSLRGAAKKQETTETEYTEIKREEKVERQDNDGEPDEMLECKEEEAAMAEDDEEIKHCVAKEEEVEDVALYSNLKDIMDEM